MRKDAIGFFWEDLAPPKPVKKEKVVRLPPVRTWESPTYLPGLEEARNTVINMYTYDELMAARDAGDTHTFDIECYPNYFLIAFRNIESKKVIYFEKYLGCELNIEWLNWVISNFKIVSFNGIRYDIPILTLALAGYSNADLKTWSDFLIVTIKTKKGEKQKNTPYKLYKATKTTAVKCYDHIDIMEVAPLDGGLKTRAARLHRKRLQDLPFPPSMMLTHDHMLIVCHYCINDLDATEGLYEALQEQLHLRNIMSKEYGIDLRSSSDAQIAEKVISHEVSRLKRARYLPKPKISPGKKYKFDAPSFLQFQTPLMNSVMQIIKDCNFVVGDEGAIDLPYELKSLAINIGKATYQLGIGGLHSKESGVGYPYVKGRKKRDIDVTSYYPSIILGQKLFPEHLGVQFLGAYEKIVVRRVEAKHSGDKDTADTLKIVINSSFGKFGSPYSVLYAPKLLIQTTLTGQLSLLMLIETFELCNITVISANTDGIVLDYADEQESLVEEIIKWWETITGFNMESTFYQSIYIANISNYMAIKPDGSIKCKGWFGDPGLSKNPTGTIISEAIRAKLKDNIPVEKTICECTDIRKFIVVRNVKGGAVCNGEYLGKTVRWYYGKGETSEIIYANNGNKVADSSGGVPMMTLSDHIPGDLYYGEYINRANNYISILGIE